MLTYGQQSIYAKGLAEGLRVLEGEPVKRVQLFPPVEVDTQKAKTACLPGKPALFGLGYTWPGLPLTLKSVTKYYKGSR